MAKKTRDEQRKRRHYHIRKRVVGTAQRPRLNVFRSNEHIHAQIINDEIGHTMASLSSLSQIVRSQADGKRSVEVAAIVGRELAKIAKEQGITRVVFDRGGYKYHGRIKALADGAREGGLEF